MTQDAQDFLMGGGTRGRGAKFPDREFGTTAAGTIHKEPEIRQQRDFDDDSLKFYDDGNPMMQLVVAIETDQRDPAIEDDDGVRYLYVKGQMKEAVSKAVRAAGAARLDVGGHLAVTYIADEPNKRGRGKPKKVYSATYRPPVGQAAEFLHGQDQNGGGGEWASPTTGQTAAAGNGPATQQAAPPAAPPGVDPDQWARMDPAQRQRVQAAMQAAMQDTPPY